MRIQGWWGRLLVAMLVLGACSTTASSTTVAIEAETSTTTSATPSTTSTTTISPESTTTTLPIEIRLPENDVEDPTEAIVAIFEYLAYLHTVPDVAPEYLELIYLPSCDCHGDVLGFLAAYSTNGWVQEDQGIEVHKAVVSQQFENGDVLLEVTDSWSPQYVRTDSGDLLRLENDEWKNEISLIGLERGDDGRWRVAVIGVIGAEGS